MYLDIVSTRKRSQSRLGHSRVSVSSRSVWQTSRSWSLSRPTRSWAHPWIEASLLNLYKSSSAVVSWNGFLSKPYHVFAGVRQGGSISPVLFSVYVNSVIEILSKCNLGCSIGLTYLGVIMYADDLLLISGSVSNLQKMIDKCLSEFSELDLHI